ncbi:hypothetical protein BKA65DRAFT_470237 [Rhexocercosporidium sp. MPI-PUGE-AT-0058]|nr:hypothetical protein BKA65DRAFT_470237 [Rhexocercosporidium sp. MPI-PUGE-AT-0058]
MSANTSVSQWLLQQGGVKSFAVLLVTVYLIQWGYSIATDPLRDIPGPTLARFTKLWLLRQYIRGDFQTTNVGVAQEICRGGDSYSIDDPDAAKIIYCHGANFVKWGWYSVWASPDPHLKNMFNDLDPKPHSDFRRKTASAYSMSSRISYEPYVDECTTLLLQRLSESASSGVTVNMGRWFQCYVFEMIGKISVCLKSSLFLFSGWPHQFTKNFGFLDKGEDVNSVIGQLDAAMAYSSCVGLWPTLHPLCMKLLTLGDNGSPGINFILK